VEPSTSPTTQSTGPLALIIQPGGSAVLQRLPVNPLACSTAIHDAIGGHYEAIAGPGGWIAYTAEDERDFPAGLPLNYQADAIARTAGWHPYPGDYAKGVLVFLGRNGVDETDVPEHVIELARAAGIID
jgi:hypothetical protein